MNASKIKRHAKMGFINPYPNSLDLQSDPVILQKEKELRELLIIEVICNRGLEELYNVE